MADIDLIITDAGRAALINAANTGTAAVTISACGVSDQPLVASADQTVLAGEIKRLTTISGDVVADDIIHVIVRDESVDVYTLRSFALYLSDGTLFAAYGQADPIMEKSSGAMLLMAVDAQFVDVDLSQVNFGDTNFLNPPATTETLGVVELATEAEAKAGSNARLALTPKTTRAALLTWLLAQDGAGSGIDADLLDGQHGSYYTDIAARLGFTPLNAAQYTDAVILAKLLNVDGAGSGLDADLLDGQHGSYYADIAARLGFNPLNAAHYTAADVLTKLLNVDGAGSGLDADLLDGKHASAFALAGHGHDALNVTDIPENANLNSYTDPGLYRQAYTAQAQSGTNYPASIAGMLEVLGGGTMRWQRYSGYNVRDIWTRSWNGSSWTAWSKVLHTHSDDFASKDHEHRSLERVMLPAGDNLNNRTTPGHFQQISNDAAASGSNYPVPRAGFLEVYGYSTQTFQRYQPLNSSDIWVRGHHGGSWSAWSLQINENWIATEFAQNRNQNGYTRLPGGLLLQWGRLSVNADAYATLTFPIAFKKAVYSIVAAVATEAGNGNAQANGPLPLPNPTLTGVQFWNAAHVVTTFWMAIGE